MAYQPIQMQTPATPNIGELLMHARQQQRDEEARRWQMVMQQGQLDMQRAQHQQQAAHQQFEDARLQAADTDAVHAEANRLYNAGLGHQAGELLKRHGYTVQAQAPQGTEPPKPQAPDEATMQRAEALPPSAEIPMLSLHEPTLTPQKHPLTLRMGGPTVSGDELPQEIVDKMTHGLPLGAPPELLNQRIARSMGVSNRLMDAEAEREQHAADVAAFPVQMQDYNTKIAAYRAQQANPTVIATNGGQSFTFDPMEVRQAQIAENARRADMFRQAFSNEPAMAAHAGDFAVRASLGEPTAQIFADYRTTTAAEAKAKAEAEKQGYEREHKGEISDRALAQKKEIARASAAASGAGQRLNLSEAHDIGEEMGKALIPVTDKKEGIAAKQRHLSEAINTVSKDPTNPVTWTNFVDGMIRTNTGKAAIIAQYNLYTHHAGGTLDQIQSWAEQGISGNLGEGIRNNLLQSAKGTMAELAREGGEQRHKFHETYAGDPRVSRNPEAQAKFRALEATTFSDLADHPTGDAIGTIRTLADGKKVKKVGENKWEPVP